MQDENFMHNNAGNPVFHENIQHKIPQGNTATNFESGKEGVENQALNFNKNNDHEKAENKRYEYFLNAVSHEQIQPGKPVNPHEVTPAMAKSYESIFNVHGVDAANNWLKQQIVSNHINIQIDNESVCREVQETYSEFFSVPAVREAIQAFVSLDLDPGLSLRDQGFPMAVKYICSIYKAGYESGMNLKSQNNAAKSRLNSSVSSARQSIDSGRVFSRAEIKSMDTDTFIQNEKAIFEQLKRGLIK